MRIDALGLIRGCLEFWRRRLADWMDTWLLEQHQPVHLGDGERSDWCRTCHETWPCPGMREAAERLAARS